MFRYEFLLFLPLLIYLILTFIRSKKGRMQISRLIPFFSCGYGPLYSLVKFPIHTINASMATVSSISIILILLWKKFSPFVYLYLFGVIITLYVSSIINDLSLYQYAKTLQMFINAVEAGDYELASKYFVVEKQEEELESLKISPKKNVNNIIGLLKIANKNDGSYLDKNHYFIDEPIGVDFILYPSGNWKIEQI